MYVDSKHGLKKYKCNLCEKEFGQRGQLKTHEGLIHSDNFNMKKEKCLSCGKLFISAAKLRTHMKIVHSDVYDFKCHICQRKFKLQCFLKYHIAESHHLNAANVQCDKCDKTYHTKNQLSKHYSSKHRVRVVVNVIFVKRNLNIQTLLRDTFLLMIL